MLTGNFFFRKLVCFLIISAAIMMLSGCFDSNTLWIGEPSSSVGVSIPYDDTKAERRLGVAAVAMISDRDDVKKNQEKIINTIDSIKDKHPEVRVIIFPETALSWYWLKGDKDGTASKKYIWGKAETIPGPSTNFVAAKAKERDVYVAFGMAEKNKDGSKIYNSLVVINPDGKIEATHRKTHLYYGDQAVGFTPGNGATLVDIDGIKTAFIICYDASSAKTAKQIVQGGAQIVFQAVADDSGFPPYFLDFDEGTNQLWNAWTVSGNKAGIEGDFYMEHDELHFAGNISIIKPTGEAVAKTADGVDGYIYHELGIETPADIHKGYGLVFIIIFALVLITVNVFWFYNRTGKIFYFGINPLSLLTFINHFITKVVVSFLANVENGLSLSFGHFFNDKHSIETRVVLGTGFPQVLVSQFHLGYIFNNMGKKLLFGAFLRLQARYNSLTRQTHFDLAPYLTIGWRWRFRSRYYMDIRLNWDIFYFAWTPGAFTGIGFGFILMPPFVSFNTGVSGPWAGCAVWHGV